MKTIKGVSPHADFYPMLSDEALAELAEDIKVNGQRHPIVVNSDGILLDGRNRRAACELLGIEPSVEVYTGDDEGAFIRSSNERRHQPTGSRAMSTALSLVEDGKRKNGRWAYGATSEINDRKDSSFKVKVSMAGTVLDVLPDLAPQVVAGDIALDDAYRRATAERERQAALEAARVQAIKDEQAREDKAGRYFDSHPDAKAWLDSKPQGAFETMRGAFAAFLEHDREARAAEDAERREREERERAKREALERDADRVRAFLSGYDTAYTIATGLHPNINEVLNLLANTDRTRFTNIKETTSWPSERP